VTSNDVLEAGAPEAIWALSEDEIVSIISENSTAATGSNLSKRASPAEECVNQKKLGPYPTTNLAVPSPDTPDAFLSTFSNVPQATNQKVINYYQVPGWSNLRASGPGANYLGLKYLTKYDVSECAAVCTNTKSCAAFNLYIERDPTVSANYKPAPCSDPPSIAAIKCVLYKVPFSLTSPVSSYVTNGGGYRASFLVRVAASVGYNSGAMPGPVDGYCGPIALPAAIQTPGGDYIRNTWYDAAVVGSDASYCALACDAQRNYANDRDPPEYPRCRAFVGYTLAKNGGAGGTQLQCALYTGSQNPQDATNYGSTRGSDTYTVANSYLYNNIADCTAV
jgi:hypothetical protein